MVAASVLARKGMDDAKDFEWESVIHRATGSRGAPSDFHAPCRVCACGQPGHLSPGRQRLTAHRRRATLPGMASIDFAAEVAELRRRHFQHVRQFALGDRSKELLAAMRSDADVLAVCIEEGADPAGSWSRLHDEMMSMIRKLSS
jgi:hypothetical protein